MLKRLVWLLLFVICVRIELHMSCIALVGQHLDYSCSGLTPASARNRRMNRRAPLSVSLRGRGHGRPPGTPFSAILPPPPLQPDSAALYSRAR
jgi:hypothetical protein